jgi:hypothetical protein
MSRTAKEGKRNMHGHGRGHGGREERGVGMSAIKDWGASEKTARKNRRKLVRIGNRRRRVLGKKASAQTDWRSR